MSGIKICLIGAGPSGMSFLYHAEKLRKTGGCDIPEVICYEKQASQGGLWNVSWRTGLDEFGEPVHGSMYRHLWSNGPKEALEFPDYTFDDHFGQEIPSFPPGEVLFDYLQGRWKKVGKLNTAIHFNHVVRSVTFNESTNMFSVLVKDLIKDEVLPESTFDYVIVATGHYSTPHVPSLPGIQSFAGRIIHSHDFREAKEFSGLRLLVVGASYSAEDISMQCVKYGAKSVICTWRTKPMGYKWPKQIHERPPLQNITGNICHFQDGSTSEVDAIILATGYKHNYPFLSDNLRLVDRNVLYPRHLYKGTIWTKGGNGRLIYIGAQNQLYTFTMFDVQALWALKYIIGDIRLPGEEEMEEKWRSWRDRCDCLQDCYEEVDFQTDFILDLSNDSKYGYNLDVGHIFKQGKANKMNNILTYRDQCFHSKFTGKKAPAPKYTFMEAFEDSLSSYLSQLNGTEYFSQ